MRIRLLAYVVLLAAVAGCQLTVQDLSVRTQSTGTGVVRTNTASVEFGEPVFTKGGPTAEGNPVIHSFTPNSTDVKPGQPIAFTVVATDPGKRPLQYNWSSTGGTLSANSGQVVFWDPPAKSGVYGITVTVSNGNGGFTAGNLNVIVRGEGPVPTAMPTTSATATPATPLPTTEPNTTPTPGAATTAVPTFAPTATPAPATPVPTGTPAAAPTAAVATPTPSANTTPAP